MEEITAAVFDMHPAKAPGIDGYTPLFYQKFWSLVKEDVCKEVLKFLNSGHLDERLNETTIILIPKIKEPALVTDYRPISLCNVVMRIISKVLANRVKDRMKDIISEQQSAFIKGRLISDNILIAQELMHNINQRKRGTDHYLAMKLDLSKAFDRVSWRFLREILGKLGFAQVWIDRVLSCVETVTYKIKVNGTFSHSITPARGLRQGDPLSPFLFILCLQWFSVQMAYYQDMRWIDGLKIAKFAPKLHHLLFADDCIVFIRATIASLLKFKEIIDCFESYAGQQINRGKSEILGSRNIDPIMLQIFADIMDMKPVDKFSRYLGLPLSINRNKTHMLGWLEEKMNSKTQEWRNAMLSSAGKEALIKACLQSYPIYAMSCFRFPKSVCDRYNARALQFWWAGSKSDRGIHWLDKESMLKSKERGGMGFRSFEALNMALLLKQLWRLLTEPELLVSKVLSAKYFHGSSLFECKVKSSDSFTWKSLLSVLDLFKIGCRPQQGSTCVSWNSGPSGHYTVKVGYDLALHWITARSTSRGESSNEDGIKLFWRRLWRMRLPNRIRILAWKVYNNALPVFDNLNNRGCSSTLGCPFCGFRNETVDHLFVSCWAAQAVWSHLDLLPVRLESTAKEWIWNSIVERDAEQAKMLLVGLWIIWRNRNNVVHNKPVWDTLQCTVKIKGYLELFLKYRAMGSISFIESDIIRSDRWTVFCDGSWNHTDRIGGYAAIALKQGIVAGCFFGWAGSVSAIDTEWKAFRTGLELATALHLDEADIVTDCIEVVKGLHSCPVASSEDWAISIRLLKGRGKWIARHIFRELNEIANLIAGAARVEKKEWSNPTAIPKICITASSFA